MFASIPPACSAALRAFTPHTLSADAPGTMAGGCIAIFRLSVFSLPGNPSMLLLRGTNDLIKLSNSYLYHVVN